MERIAKLKISRNQMKGEWTQNFTDFTSSNASLLQERNQVEVISLPSFKLGRTDEEILRDIIAELHFH